MHSAVQGQGSQPGPNIRNGVDLDDLLLLLAKNQLQLSKACTHIMYLKTQVSRAEVETKDLIQKVLQLKREKGPVNL